LLLAAAWPLKAVVAFAVTVSLATVNTAIRGTWARMRMFASQGVEGLRRSQETWAAPTGQPQQPIATWLPRRLDAALAAPAAGWPYVFAAALIPVTLLAWTPAASPLRGLWSRPAGSTPHELISTLSCIERRDVQIPFQPPSQPQLRLAYINSCPPSERVIAWLHAHVPVDAVLAINKWNEWPIAVFVPQQIVIWGGAFENFRNEQALFADYYALYNHSLSEHAEQPFFNDRESRAEREQYLRILGVTHVVVDPFAHDRLVPELNMYPDLLASQYDDGRWAVYQVRPARSGGER
jgi:hypothetical protein